jgi:hypothetical protein
VSNPGGCRSAASSDGAGNTAAKAGSASSDAIRAATFTVRSAVPAGGVCTQQQPARKPALAAVEHAA